MTPPEDDTTADESSAPEPTKEELQQAFKAFKKRLKLNRLDDESRLGHGAMTKGGASGIVGIKPPEQFPQEIWDALEDKGKIEYLGNGLYGRVIQ